jgi:hypothetical protein
MNAMVIIRSLAAAQLKYLIIMALNRLESKPFWDTAAQKLKRDERNRHDCFAIEQSTELNNTEQSGNDRKDFQCKKCKEETTKRTLDLQLTTA